MAQAPPLCLITPRRDQASFAAREKEGGTPGERASPGSSCETGMWDGQKGLETVSIACKGAGRPNAPRAVYGKMSLVGRFPDPMCSALSATEADLNRRYFLLLRHSLGIS